jgi:Zn-dependent peptidase ImmA (M78 family)
MSTNSAIHDARGVLIAREARSMQMELWGERVDLWGTEEIDPLDLLEPGIALRLKGFRIQTVSTLGEMISNGRPVQVAGMIDRKQQLVRVASSRFSMVEQRFTAAHELAHAILHPNGALLHRDRPADSTRWQKDPEEREADFFAACFLMPEKQVRIWFRRLFLTSQFALNDDTAFALCTKPLDTVLPCFRSCRDLSLAIARAISYNGRQFKSLAELFRVSPTAMAYRLEQLGLVVEPRFALRA